MLEKLVFNLLACSLFIIIFFKIIRRDDANYIILLVLQAIGITISFIEIKLQIEGNTFWKTIRYLFSIVFAYFFPPTQICWFIDKNSCFSQWTFGIFCDIF